MFKLIITPGVRTGGKFTKKTACMDNSKPTFEQLCDPAYRRAQLITEKSGAVFVIFNELNGLLNKTRIAEDYFQRTHAWFSQKLNGCTLHKVQYGFTESEYHQLAEAFRDIARKLNIYADEIDAAAMEEQ